MSRSIKNFAPYENKTITWAAASNSQNVQFTTKVSLGSTFIQDSSDYFPNTLRVVNNTGGAVFLKTGTGSAPTAATTDLEIPAGVVPVDIDIGQADYVAVIPVGSATGSVYLSRGLGT
jgi:hypothetical protein